MHKFKDKEGVEWSLSVDMQSAMLLKSEAGVDILDIAEEKDLLQLSTDLVTLGACIWLLVEDQATEKKLTEKEFFRRLDGDAIDAATTALVAECFDFFPPQKRLLLKSTWDKLRSVESKGIERAMKVIQETTDEDFEKLVTGYASGLKQPVESPSPPGDLPSAN